MKSRIRPRPWRGQRASPWDDDLVRAELFSIERLEQHAQSLAAAQEITSRPVSRRPLGVRLRDNGSVLLEAYGSIAAAVGEGRAITPAAEWLLDNFHVVEDQIREIRDDLPPSYYRQLPKLASGPFAGYPRVFGIAWAFVSHTDSLFEPEMLSRFLRAYQRVQPLEIGELWAVAITLRIVLVENLRRAARLIVDSCVARQDADALADRILGSNGNGVEPDVLLSRRHDRASVSRAFLVQLVQRLRDQDPRRTPALLWLEKCLAARSTSSEQIVQDEHQRQGSANVTVRNVITSMRLISDVDWAELFESVSLVDAILGAASDFKRMDFATRNLYRTAVEELARGSQRTELEIAREALRAARESVDGDGRARDPGYHLIAGGRHALESAIGYRAPLRARPRRLVAAIGVDGYAGGAAVVTAIVLGAVLLLLVAAGTRGRALGLFALLAAIPSIDVAIALLNHVATRGLGARILPGMALREGVPARLRTLVAVPTLLTTREAIEEQIERLEVHHLASLEGDLHFALLSDWTDAATEHADGDAALLDAAAAGIARLNHRHGPASAGDRFLLLHRRRVWCEGQRQWLGWERKRGKIHELNQLLRGATDTTFLGVDGRPPAVPPDVRYVITLDADTRLPRDAARRLIGKLAHPLNEPRFDPVRGRVVEGYAVLQPRVAVSLPVGREGSLFQRVFSRGGGIDSYACAVSDVYQDLFGEGSYAGKGIYAVDAFEAALGGRVPESALLSHDLFEGTFARAGVVSDVEVVEEFPARYDVAAARQHRWARGDWQLLPWILGYAGDARERGARGFPRIGRWKMLDNLRRTLSAPASVVALGMGASLPLQSCLVWTAFVVSAIATPTLLPVLAVIVPRRSGVAARIHLGFLAADLWLAISQTLLLIAFLAHQAWLMGDAIARTLYRLLVSRENLLEWVTAAQTKVSPRLDLLGFYRQMAGGVALGGAAGILACRLGDARALLAAPFALVWLAAPAIARRISISPRVAGRVAVSDEDARALRRVARRTWRFFETFVTADDRMLPPDNFQEDPRPALAHRTSPTNLGLYLLAAVSAHDFGWVGRAETIDRLEATLDTMNRLARFRGHFYNWYDTQDLRPLEPRYVSAVDSGNLAGHLIALAQACRGWRGAPGARRDCRDGIEDALSLTRDALLEIPAHGPTDGPTDTRSQLQGALDRVSDALREAASAAAGARAAEAALGHAAADLARIAEVLADERGDEAASEVLYWADATCRSIESDQRDGLRSGDAAGALERRLEALEASARSLAQAMDFGFLLDSERKLLSIGYLVAEGRLDPSCYDLLASEARLASFVAIAKGDVPARHWFRLGRAVTPIEHGAALISWSGSMFEYLMPSLVMRAPAGSLLEQSSRLVVRRQISHATSLGVPWGISESAYNTRDLELTYQYSNFGVPGLGLKRGLSENLVVAPYATALASMVDPGAAARNFERLRGVGARGRYGFYEALDYTPARVPEGKTAAIVRAFMAHHQGMTVVALANALLDGRMRARFHAEPIVQASELLLQERTPRDVAVAHPRAEEVQTAARVRASDSPPLRRLRSARSAVPEAHLLSNGRYAVMLTGAGSGYSRWRDLAVTRWREDTTRDDWGAYVFVRDVQDDLAWSAGYQPSAVEPDRYEVNFSEDRAQFIRSDGTLTTTLDVVVSPEHDAEVRRVSLSNGGTGVRILEVTSYAELVLAAPDADASHPSFSKLFVETEYVAELGAVLATRRTRSAAEPAVWAAHHAVLEGEGLGEIEIETDRARFLGRGRDLRAPLAVAEGRRLSGTVGAVLDAVFALRRRVRIEPGATARIAFWTVVAPSRAEVLDLIDKHRDANAFERAATRAWTQAQVQLRHMGVEAVEASLFQRLAGHVLYGNPAMRPPSDALRRGAGGPAALWAHGVSGDLPIVLVRIDAMEDLALVRQLLRAHEYWRMKQLAVDLVILNERGSSYLQDVQVAVEAAIRTRTSGRPVEGEPARGSVFALRADLLSVQARARLPAVARVVLSGSRGSLWEQLSRARGSIGARPPPLGGIRPESEIESGRERAAAEELEFFNGLGGFAANGREYVTVLGRGQTTPAPWINVIANPSFGFQVGAEGSGYTWSLSSRENQLTPWSNDAVSDRPGEVLYVRDEASGELWGPTASPLRHPTGLHIARHGQGYSRFEHTSRGIALELTQYVPLDAPIKISRLVIRNTSERTRRLSVTAYVEWVLGSSRGAAAPFVVTEIDPATGALLARNPWNAAFGSRVAFADLAGRQAAWTGDRREFLGQHGALDRPAALAGEASLSGRVGAGLDPCAALQVPLELQPGAVLELPFFLGETASAAEAQQLIARYRAADLDAELRAVVAHWDDLLGTVQVKTPDRSLDVLLNRWLLYQTLVCRMWARGGFYQASGAYGFRDQLQDSMALVVSRPALAREHLLRAAARQFVEGDVQHWWLPGSGQGVRTRISDDRIWLAYATAHYVDASGDLALLDEKIPFLEGQMLDRGEHEAYFLPSIADEAGSLFEHCARALDQSLAVGEHGLPLIGTGDWNDGMNRVGEGGKGESVWLGWFLHAALSAFAALARGRGEPERVARWRSHAAALQVSLEVHGWDGDWYRRGYFDDGTPLGSAASDECRIDSIAQSWSAISGAGDPGRAGRAMDAVEEQLIQPARGLALLFAPPFDRSPLDPGYIKAYPPGIRENGGQYTHAAAWAVIALAALGRGDQAADLFALLDPIQRTSTRSGMQRYRVEPYVIAADVYSVAPHVGRGGWTWYTGSAGWLYRAGLESILGFRLQAGCLLLAPCIPARWPRFEICFAHGGSRYEILVENPRGVCRGVVRAELDGETLPRGETRIALVDDGRTHRVRVVLG